MSKSLEQPSIPLLTIFAPNFFFFFSCWRPPPFFPLLFPSLAFLILFLLYPSLSFFFLPLSISHSFPFCYFLSPPRPRTPLSWSRHIACWPTRCTTSVRRTLQSDMSNLLILSLDNDIWIFSQWWQCTIHSITRKLIQQRQNHHIFKMKLIIIGFPS